MTDQKHILILGAGIIGLQIARTLLQAGHKVTVIAKHFPGDESIEYTSPWAGAHWRSYASLDDAERQSWDLSTWRYWHGLLAAERREGRVGESGLVECGCWEYGPASMHMWFEKEMEQFRECTADELAGLPASVERGFFRETIALNAPKYLQYVYDKVRQLGAQFMRAEIIATDLPAVLDACDAVVREHEHASKVAAYVNATGLGARKLVPDEAVHPIRGVTVLVKGSVDVVKAAQWGTDPENPGSSLIIYVLPRPGTNTTVVGGTKQMDNWTAQATEEEVKTILERAKVFVPELLHDGEFEVVKTQVGLRPGRHGGARVELEQIGGRLVCHAYGNASCGYQNSVGVAEKVQRLLETEG